MGLFGRKKEKELLNLSSVQLVNILKKAILLAEEDVNARSYTLGPEIMFEYHDTIHFIGVKYDKKRAKAAKQKVFCKEFVSVYLDKQNYLSPEELYENAVVEGVNLKDITSEIMISADYKEIL